MRLTIRRAGSLRRVNLVDALGKALKDNERLSRELVQTKADLALARSSSNEWRDRYKSAVDPNVGRDKAYAGWGSSR